jgi:hypothetical protein
MLIIGKTEVGLETIVANNFSQANRDSRAHTMVHSMHGLAQVLTQHARERVRT